MNIAPWVEWFTEKFINDGGGARQDLTLMDPSVKVAVVHSAAFMVISFEQQARAD